MTKICPKCLERLETTGGFCHNEGKPLLTLDGDDPLVGTVLAGRFLILSPVGKGGMGTVYRACQLSVERIVALKLLLPREPRDPVLEERFVREARAIAALDSPHTVIVHDFGIAGDGTMFIAMELVKGESLAEMIARQGRLAPRLAAEILIQICASLAEAHEKHIVHRDLKPSNVMIGGSGVKVVDFGLVKVLDEVTPALTKEGFVCGTPSYMSPEQCTAGVIGPETDIYALGVMIHEMLSGRVPYGGDQLAQIYAMHVTHPIPRLSALLAPSALLDRWQEVMDGCLTKKPEDRYPTAAALSDELSELRALGGEEPFADAGASPPALPARRAVGGAWIAASAGALLAIVPAVWWGTPAELHVEPMLSADAGIVATLREAPPPPPPATAPHDDGAAAKKPRPARVSPPRLRDVEVQGGLSYEAAAEPLRASERAWAKCFTESRSASPLSVQLLVQPTGQVGSLVVNGAGGADDQASRRFETCIKSGAFAMRFPAFTGAFARVLATIGT